MGLILTPSARRPSGDGLEFLFRALSPREAGVYLGVSEDTVRSEAEAGRLPGQKVGDDWRFLGLAVARWLVDGSHAPPSIEAPIASGAGTKLAREAAAFRALLPDLLRTHPGLFVAIHDGLVVAHGQDQAVVARTAYETCGYQEILVTRVTDDPRPAVYVGGTPIGTPEME